MRNQTAKPAPVAARFNDRGAPKNRQKRAACCLYLIWFTAFMWLPLVAHATEVIRLDNFKSVPGEIVPEGWCLKRITGTPHFIVEQQGSARPVLRLISDQASFGIVRTVAVDINHFPYLNWHWKVTALPSNGDARQRLTDDQAIQVYVAFLSTEDGAMNIGSPILGYLWDNEAPIGWTGRSPQFGASNIRCTILRNKKDGLEKWVREKRNIAEDYLRLFGRLSPAPARKSVTLVVAVFINSHHTKSRAESAIEELYFSND